MKKIQKYGIVFVGADLLKQGDEGDEGRRRIPTVGLRGGL
ncbi:hypothetical protein BVRB_6g142050 [Beta vulgaris subsp. vulgaris]|nr:hypothetical protein BVRB_6g142050 [Beta vulgaris subsp. vulgaris]